MTINNELLSDIQVALANSDTSELAFRNALLDVAMQVDNTQVDGAAVRTISLTGDVEGSATLTINDETDMDIEIETTIQLVSVAGEDIISDAIINRHVLDDSLSATKINSGSKLRFRIMPATGTAPLFEMDGLTP